MDTAARTSGFDPANDAPPDVFVSYARENRETAKLLAEALLENKLIVWWDHDLVAGSQYAAVIEAKLRSAAAVVGLWSRDSVASNFVRDECGLAQRNDKLVPVRIEEVDLPLGFGQLHTLDLLEWEGDSDDDAFQTLLLEIERRRAARAAHASGAAGGTASGPLPLMGAAGTPSGGWRIGRRSLRQTLLALSVIAVLGGGGYYIKHSADLRAEQARLEAQRAEAARVLERNRTEADRHFRAGLEFQTADVPRLENALNEYLTALERLPSHGRARYYLAHVYAQTGRSADALGAFQLALTASDAKLDHSQEVEAQRQIVALAPDAGEATPISRPLASAGDTERPKPAPPPVVVAGAGPEPSGGAMRGSGGGAGGSGAGPGGVLMRGGVRAPAPVGASPAPARPTSPTATPSATASAGPRTPPHIDPPAATATRLERSVAAMFDDNKDRRVNATTNLVVDADDLSDAVPIAIDRALTALRMPRPLAARDSSGVINTLVLLKSAMPGTLVSNRRAIEQLLDAAGDVGDYTRQQAAAVRERLRQATNAKPIGYLQIANESQRPVAELIAERLRNFGYAAPAIEVVGARAPKQTELRVQGASDRAYSRWITKITTELAGAAPAVTPLRNAKPKVDTYEIWIGQNVCAPGGVQAPGCG